MATELYMYDGTSYQLITELHMYDGATYQQIKEAYCWNGANWRHFYQLQYIGADWPDSDTSWFTTTISPTTAECYITLNTDGTYTISQDAGSTGGNYLTIPGVGAGNNYWVKYINGTGSTINLGGLTNNTYYQLNVARTIGMTQSSTGVRAGSGIQILIAEDSGGTGAVTWTGSISAEVTV